MHLILNNEDNEVELQPPLLLTHILSQNSFLVQAICGFLTSSLLPNIVSIYNLFKCTQTRAKRLVVRNDFFVNLLGMSLVQSVISRPPAIEDIHSARCIFDAFIRAGAQL